MSLEDRIVRVSQALARARRVLAITGAGISADSGLPVYRGTGGIYDQPDLEQGLSIEQILSAEIFRSQPALTWNYLKLLGRVMQSACYNRGHQVLQEIECFVPEFLLVTQNVDGLHRQAGSREPCELHGSLGRLRCDTCGWWQPAPPYSELADLPSCSCGALLRPDIVLFDEYLPHLELDRLQRFLDPAPEVCLLIGTSCQFAYLASPVVQIQRAGGLVVEINPAETHVTPLAGVRLPLRSAEALDLIWNRTLGLSHADVEQMRES